MILGVPKETYPGERRVAVVPASLAALKKAGLEVLIEPGAGADAGYPDTEYTAKGASLAESRADVFGKSEIIAQVRAAGAASGSGSADFPLLRSGQAVIAFLDPLSAPAETKALAERGVNAFSMELMPRITRAQSMDALSSMATVAGYKAVLIAAGLMPRMCPLLMTAAGTIKPARALIIGAGVAGLQAISMARRLGAIVYGYDVRSAVKEQVESLGAKFVELPLEAAEGSGGYAKQMSDEYYKKQRELMGDVVAESDLVITTAAIPGKQSPVLVTKEMVQRMRPGSVIVDLAAERGGNCELTKADETVIAHGVTIVGPTNLPATVPYHASQMYSKNVDTFLAHLVKKGEFKIDLNDEITAETLVARGGEVVHNRIRGLLGLPELKSEPAPDSAG